MSNEYVPPRNAEKVKFTHAGLVEYASAGRKHATGMERVMGKGRTVRINYVPETETVTVWLRGKIISTLTPRRVTIALEIGHVNRAEEKYWIERILRDN